MGFFYFLGRKKFYLHFFIIIFSSFFLIWLTLQVLKVYTRHGKEYIVPNFVGSPLTDLDNENLQEYFNFVIIDSVYDQHFEKGMIIQQDPLPNAKVKRYRKIYLTIVATMPEKVMMPNLMDLSLRQSIVTLQSSELRLNSIDYIPHFAENAVLHQLFKGDTIEPGTLINKGSYIDLVLGEGANPRMIKPPFLIAKKRSEAHNIIHLSSFNIGNEYYLDGEDTMYARIYKHEPSWDTEDYYEKGESIDLWYRSDLNFDFEELLKSLLPDTIPADSMLIDSTYFYLDEEL